MLDPERLQRNKNQSHQADTNGHENDRAADHARPLVSLSLGRSTNMTAGHRRAPPATQRTGYGGGSKSDRPPLTSGKPLLSGLLSQLALVNQGLKARPGIRALIQIFRNFRPVGIRFDHGAKPMAVFRKESRKPRHTTRHDAWMLLDGGFAKRNCTILDLSSGGARIKLIDTGPIGNNLSLALTGDVRKVKHCRLIWRKDKIIGVEFRGRT
ncbi:PilZ domain-containing protein [Afipia broomeae]|nr:PilZ domain-containing protein [Afipia broomeae]